MAVIHWRLLWENLVCNILPRDSSLSYLIGKGKQSLYEEFKFWYSSSNSYLLFKLCPNWTHNLLLHIYVSSCISYLLLKARISLLPLRRETSVIFSLILSQSHSSVLWMVPLPCFLPFLFFIFHLYTFSFLDCCNIFLIAFTAYIPFQDILTSE